MMQNDSLQSSNIDKIINLSFLIDITQTTPRPSWNMDYGAEIPLAINALCQVRNLKLCLKLKIYEEYAKYRIERYSEVLNVKHQYSIFPLIDLYT